MATLKLRLSKREINVMEAVLTEKSVKDIMDDTKKEEYLVLLEKLQLLKLIFEINSTIPGIVLTTPIPISDKEMPSL